MNNRLHNSNGDGEWSACLDSEAGVRSAGLIVHIGGSHLANGISLHHQAVQRARIRGRFGAGLIQYICVCVRVRSRYTASQVYTSNVDMGFIEAYLNDQLAQILDIHARAILSVNRHDNRKINRPKHIIL